MHEFEVFRKDGADARHEPVVTLQRRGMITLNGAAFQALEAPVAVELLYNREQQVIGMRAVDQRAANAHFVRPAARTGLSQYVISASAYVRYYDIDTTEVSRWVGYLDGHTLCVDLRGDALPSGSREAHGRRRSKNGSDQDADTG